jgi:hypothetical protein
MTDGNTNLPIQGTAKKPDAATRQFFDAYYQKPLEYPANEVDAVIAFFEKRGFEKSACYSISSALLKQAKIDKVPVFKVLDTLKGLTEVQLSTIVAEVLNYSRKRTSTLGFTVEDDTNYVESRNIIV